VVAWPWYNFAVSQRRPYCSSVNSHSLVGFVSQQWDAVNWAYVLCDRRIHNGRASRSANLHPMHLPILQFSCRLFGKTSHNRGLSASLQSRFGSLRILVFFPKAKIAVESEEICKCDGHTVHKLSQRRLTADWLVPRESDCSRIHSKVASDWLLSYIKVTLPVLEIFKWLDIFLTCLVRCMEKPYRTGRVCCRSL
jgi:hypothetical protein